MWVSKALRVLSYHSNVMGATTGIGKSLGEDALEKETFCIWKTNFVVVNFIFVVKPRAFWISYSCSQVHNKYSWRYDISLVNPYL